MTAIEAIENVEAAALSLGITEDGAAVSAPEALGTLGAFFGAEWSSWEDRFEAGTISPQEYCDGICRLIDAYSKRKFQRRYADRINMLADRQREGVA